MDAIFQWLVENQGLAVWLGAVPVAFVFCGAVATWLKSRGWHRVPVVQAAVGATALMAIGAGFALLANHYLDARSAQTALNVGDAPFEQSNGGDNANGGKEKQLESDETLRVVGKPIIVDDVHLSPPWDAIADHSVNAETATGKAAMERAKAYLRKLNYDSIDVEVWGKQGYITNFSIQRHD